MKEKKTVHAIINGRVQGVFFRMETLRAAKRFGICGWVMNRPDGTVEAMFEGDADRVDAMLEWCRKGPPLAVVFDIDIEERAYSGVFADFSIRYSDSA